MGGSSSRALLVHSIFLGQRSQLGNPCKVASIYTVLESFMLVTVVTNSCCCLGFSCSFAFETTTFVTFKASTSTIPKASNSTFSKAFSFTFAFKAESFSEVLAALAYLSYDMIPVVLHYMLYNTIGFFRVRTQNTVFYSLPLPQPTFLRSSPFCLP